MAPGQGHFYSSRCENVAQSKDTARYPHLALGLPARQRTEFELFDGFAHDMEIEEDKGHGFREVSS